MDISKLLITDSYKVPHTKQPINAMTNKETAAAIRKTARAYRTEHKKYCPKDEVLVDISHSGPYVAINLPNDNEYFFQGEEAGNILEEATTASNKFNTSLEDTLLWLASGWG